MKPRHGLPFVVMILFSWIGCSSSNGLGHGPDASSGVPATDAANATDHGSVDLVDGTAAVVDSRATVPDIAADIAADSNATPADAEVIEAGPEASDLASVQEAGALTCTPEQLAARQPSGGLNSLLWADVPAEVSSFLTSFLPTAYIEDHFRFLTASDGIAHHQLYMKFEYGCETVSGGQIQWGLAICGGDVRYVGPSRDWQVKVDRVEAAQQIAAAGCDASNLELDLAQVNTPIPGVRECLGLSFYPEWVAGGKSTPCPYGTPIGCSCRAQTCSLQAETGVLTTQKPLAACSDGH
jgi:hypothetical protein